MKAKFLKSLIPFIVIAVIINFFLNQFYSKVMEKSHLMEIDSEFHSWNHEVPINYLIIGSSHSFGLQKEYVENAVHFGSWGEEVSRTYYKLKYVLEESNYQVKNVLMNFDLGLTRRADVSENYFYWIRYVDFLELGREKDCLPDYIYKYLKGLLFKYADGEMDIFEYFTLDESKSGALRSGDYIPPLNALDTTSNRFSDECLKKELNQVAINYLVRLVELCEKHQVNLVLIKFPVTKYFYYKHSACYDPDEYYSVIEEEIQKNSTGTYIIDFQKLYFDDDSKFRDPHHLSGPVRPGFTQLVVERLNALNL